MKTICTLILLAALLFALTACGSGHQSVPSTGSPDGIAAASGREAPAAPASEAEAPRDAVESGTEGSGAAQPIRQIQVLFGDSAVIYQLNDSAAADSLYRQLPLTVEVEDYSTNEKIFYPPEELDTGNTPLAQAGAGTLAYYAPWGDVVMFYGDYSENASLFELGQVVSGGELVGGMSGSITIDIVPQSNS